MSRKRINKTELGLKVIDINAKGMGVAKSEDGAVYFIKNVVPGDIVDIRAYKKHKGYFEAEPIKWVTTSEDRRDPPCEHFGICGGCKWQHLSYEAQLKFKEKGVLRRTRQTRRRRLHADRQGQKAPLKDARDLQYRHIQPRQVL